MKYKIEIKKSVVKALKKIPQSDQIKIALAFKELSDDPRPVGCLKLSDSSFYRIRCGIYRIIYDIQDDKLVIIILKVAHRKESYQKK